MKKIMTKYAFIWPLLGSVFLWIDFFQCEALLVCSASCVGTDGCGNKRRRRNRLVTTIYFDVGSVYLL